MQGILTRDEAQLVAEMLRMRDGAPDFQETNVGLATASLADDGQVHIELLGAAETHASLAAFSAAYGLHA